MHEGPGLAASIPTSFLLGVVAAVGAEVARDLPVAEVPRVRKAERHGPADSVGGAVAAAGAALGPPWTAAAAACLPRIASVPAGRRAPRAPGT